MTLHLSLSESQTYETLHYQVLAIELTRKDRLISPQDLEELSLPSGIDTTGGIVISGRAPIWLYAYLVHECHPTSWVACYDPRLGAVVVATHSHQVTIGQVLPLPVSNGRKPQSPLCPALMVVGPPNSGKTVFSHALFQSLLTEHPNIYLQRAHWDGEGNYVLELGEEATEEEIEAFKATNKGGLTPEFFPYHAQAILQLRRQKSLVIVDVGGMVQPEKVPLLEACTHYLIISSQKDAVESWHEFCRDRGNLKPVAVVHSSLQDCEFLHREKPFLELTCGKWVYGEKLVVPKVLRDACSGLCLSK